MSKTEALTTFLFAGVSRYQTAQKNVFDTGELQQLNHNLKIGTAIFLFHDCGFLKQFLQSDQQRLNHSSYLLNHVVKIPFFLSLFSHLLDMPYLNIPYSKHRILQP